MFNFLGKVNQILPDVFFFLNLMIFARDKNVKTTKVRFSQKQLKNSFI